MPARLLPAYVRRFCAIGAVATIGGCSYLPPTIVPIAPDPTPDRLEGVADIDPNAKTIRILFIHGIGEHDACDPDTLLIHLTKALQVEQQPPDRIDETATCASHFVIPEPLPIDAPGATSKALMYFYTFRSATRTVKFAFLRWSPLTESIKATALTEPGLPHHAWLADVAKTFEQNNLADVVLYGGKYREVIRPAIERGLCHFVGGVPDPNNPRLCVGGAGDTPTAIVTHSLGGYMLMDAMSDIYAKNASGAVAEEHSAAEKVGRYLNQIFMLANQLKLLDLTTRTQEQSGSQVVRNFRTAWNAAHNRQPTAGAVGKRRQMIAVSDPNDILSWQVTSMEFNRPEFTIANVYLGTTGEFLGLYHAPIIPIAASPVAAHENYLKDDDVMDIIACGMTGATINRCTTKTF
jgi:hypothetical protein